MITALFNTITSAITGFVGSISAGLTGISGLIYDSTNSEFSFIGILMLAGVAVGAVWLIFRMVRGLTKGVAR